MQPTKPLITLAALMLMCCSLACTSWVFFDLFDGGWVGGIAAFSGSAMQVIAYGVSADISKRKCINFFSLSIVSCIFIVSVALSFISISSFIQIKSGNLESKDYVSSVTKLLIDAKLKESQLSLKAAEQGIPERFREQGKKFIAASESSVTEANELLNVYQQGSRSAALPTHSAQQWFKQSPYAVYVFSIVMALLFDITPVFSFFHLSMPAKKIDSNLRKETKVSVDEEKQKQLDVDHIYSKAKQKLLTGQVDPTYRSICKEFAISNPKAKDILDRGITEGYISKTQRGFCLSIGNNGDSIQ